LLTLLTVTIVFIMMYTVESKFNTMTIELGDVVSTDPGTYIAGRDWSVEAAKVDVSSVDQSTVGSYFIYLDHAWQHFTYVLIIEDTTPPEIDPVKDNIYLKRGDSYDYQKFTNNVSDLGGIREILVNDEEFVSFEECGEHQIEVRAFDENGNQSEVKLDVIVDDAPQIEGVKEIYIGDDEEVDFALGLAAFDDTDGDVTESISVYTGKVDFEKPGDYEIIIKARDSYGLESFVINTVHISTPEEIQNKINHHLINCNNEYIYGALNLYDAGYYEEDDIQNVLESMEPCFVHFYFPTSNGYSEGSGFIIAIRDEDIVLCTNAHVVRNAKGNGDEVHFFDGTFATPLLYGEKNTFDDVAFLTVDKSQINEETLAQLRSVHIDNDYWENLGDTEAISIGFRAIKSDGSVWGDRIGNMVQKIAHSDIKGTESWVMTETTIHNFPGSSGSAVLDGHGNLIAMVRATSVYGTYYRYWCTTFREIMDQYKAVTGQDAYYR